MADDAVAVGPVNIGSADDYRIPDVSVIHAQHKHELYVPTAVAVVEILSPSEVPLRRLFPWAPDGAALWPTLLWANGRVDPPQLPARPGPDWVWHCAPLDEWDGTIPRRDDTPPNRYRRDEDGHRWRPVW